jgi:hypothetical protein
LDGRAGLASLQPGLTSNIGDEHGGRRRSPAAAFSVRRNRNALDGAARWRMTAFRGDTWPTADPEVAIHGIHFYAGAGTVPGSRPIVHRRELVAAATERTRWR